MKKCEKGKKEMLRSQERKEKKGAKSKRQKSEIYSMSIVNKDIKCVRTQYLGF